MSKKKPFIKQFKPGNKPYLEFDGTILNANVPWNEVVNDILKAGVSSAEISIETHLLPHVIGEILEGNYDGLCFKAGAMLITLHCRYRQELYLN
jgi:hypothetical protein